MQTVNRVSPLESTPAARELQISVSRLHQLADKLDPPILRTSTGRRLFYCEDLDRIRRVREERMGSSPLALTPLGAA